MTSTTIRIGGVPEHFNLPIHLAIESGEFTKKGIDLEWTDYPGGTGSMTQALRDDECDVCVLLTEGIITDIINGNPSKIISGYVKSPLTWGIHTYVSNDESITDTIFNEQIAISRKGSGSHLMPIVDALIQGKSIEEDQFVVIKDINGALDSLQKQETSVFYWEKFTTKPFVKNGKLKRVSEFISPWPCFMIAATEKFINNQPDALDSLLKVIHSACEKFMNNVDAPKLVSERYNLLYKDAEYWYHGTEWTTDSWVSDKMLKNVVFALKEAKIIPSKSTTSGLVWTR